MIVAIKDFPNYFISNDGRVFSIKDSHGNITTKHELKSRASGVGYLQVTLYKEKKKYPVSIHRLVAEHFVLNPENKPQVNHKDGVKTHNIDTNLEWVTCRENMKHALDFGLLSSGEYNPHAKLTMFKVEQIRQLFSTGQYDYKQLADKFDVHKSNIGKIIRNKLWVTATKT